MKAPAPPPRPPSPPSPARPGGPADADPDRPSADDRGLAMAMLALGRLSKLGR